METAGAGKDAAWYREAQQNRKKKEIVNLPQRGADPGVLEQFVSAATFRRTRCGETCRLTLMIFQIPCFRTMWNASYPQCDTLPSTRT